MRLETDALAGIRTKEKLLGRETDTLIEMRTEKKTIGTRNRSFFDGDRTKKK